MIKQITVRTLVPDEVAQLVQWAKDEAWNPGLHDAPAFYAADPEGFIGCIVDGELASGISCVAYSDQFGFIGLYITRPDMRGNGYGLRVWNAAMERLRLGTIGLDGVPEQQSNYASMGFEKAYETVRWSGVCTFNNDEKIYDILELGLDQLEQVSQYDRAVFPASRVAFLDKWLVPPRSAFAIVEEGELAGYTVLRECYEGYKLGPLFANNEQAARRLLNAAINACAGAELHIDVPASQVAFSTYLADKGFTAGFETARMYKGEAPKIDMAKIFAITTLELG